MLQSRRVCKVYNRQKKRAAPDKGTARFLISTDVTRRGCALCRGVEILVRHHRAGILTLGGSVAVDEFDDRHR